MIFIFLSIFTYSCQNVANKELGRRYGKLGGAAFYQDIFLVFFSLITMFCAGKFSVPGRKYLITAAIFGALYIITIFLILKSLEYGAIGDTTIIVNLGLFFSSIFGIIKYGDEVTVISGIGIACMLAVILLSIPTKAERKKSPDKLKWFLCAFGAASLNGCLAVIKRIVAGWNSSQTAGKIEMTTFLGWGFAFSTICAGIIILVKRPPVSTFKSMYFTKKSWITYICVIVSGIGSACGNLFQMVAISRGVSSAIVYPVCAGSLITVAWLISVLYYKETKVTAKNIISLILCIFGIMFAQM